MLRERKMKRVESLWKKEMRRSRDYREGKWAEVERKAKRASEGEV